YAQLIKGCNSARKFKNVKTDYTVEEREPQSDEAEKLLSSVIDASQGEQGVDNITLNMTIQRMANVQNSAGKKKEARATVKRMVDIFNKKSLKPHVLNTIADQAAEITSKL
ncbi:hypothetical protein MJD09_01615, partial [bacterium]|nr:hypothetical protein [bacterium]